MTVLGFENRIRKFFYALCLTLVCVVVSPLSVYSENYSVSYLWHSDLSKISVYKKKILVFSTRIVSRIHSHLLKSSGLEPAVVIKSRDWKPQNKKIALPERLASGAQAKKITSKPEDPLEDEIEKYIKSQRRRGVIRSNERTAWVVYDFKTDKKIVSINEDVPMEAASLIKPFIALAFFRGGGIGEIYLRKKIAEINGKNDTQIRQPLGRLVFEVNGRTSFRAKDS